MKVRETRAAGVRPEPPSEGSEPGAACSPIVTSPASAYIRIVSDSFHIAGSRALGELSRGTALELCRPQTVQFVVVNYPLLKLVLR